MPRHWARATIRLRQSAGSEGAQPARTRLGSLVGSKVVGKFLLILRASQIGLGVRAADTRTPDPIGPIHGKGICVLFYAGMAALLLLLSESEYEAHRIDDRAAGVDSI